MKKSPIQKISFVYAAMFFVIFFMNYVPAFHDESGRMFGLFKLDTIDDVLHLGSAIWALAAGLYSAGATVFYFRWFGLAYLLDGLVGFFFGRGYLNGEIFTLGPLAASWPTKLGLSGPHILIGGTLVLFGFVLSKKLSGQR
jgi:hypothetical protein